MLLTLVVGVAAFFQYAAAILALRVLRATGRSLGWMLIAAVAFLMAARRSLVLYRLLLGDASYAPDPIGELDALAASVLMAVAVARIGPFFLSIRRSEEELRKRTRELVKRVTELNCLYAISTLVEKKGDSLNEILGAVAKLIVASMQYSDIAAARVTVGDGVFQTSNFVETHRKLECEISAHGRRFGRVEVCYPVDQGGDAERVFLEEERSLIRAIAERLGRIIERIRAEEARAALQQQLHQAQKMEALGQLASGVAHDFNNLVTVLLGHVAAAKAELDADHRARGALDAIERATNEAGGVTESLLKFSGKLPAEKRPLDLCAAVEESARLLRRILPPAIELVVDTSVHQPVWVSADSTQLQQVILNLAINARDAMPEGGTLRFAVSVDGSPDVDASPDAADRAAAVARLRVTDTGVGMPSGVVARVFDPFFTTKPRGQGTGLGLSIVQRIVEDHGGSIAVESQEGVGSTFTVSLPCVEPGAAQDVPGFPRGVPCGNGETILLAEGNQHVRAIVSTTLQTLNYQVLPVADGGALLDSFTQHADRIQLLVIDLDLPVRKGLDCLREIRASGACPPAIVVASAVDADLEDQLAEGVVLLRKPYQVAELAGLVGRVLAPS
jgi:signal transduction histidine kinase